MSYAAHHKDFTRFTAYNGLARSYAPQAKPGLLRRIYDAIQRSRQVHANREIARLAESHGNVLTDSAERDIMERVLTDNWIR